MLQKWFVLLLVIGLLSGITLSGFAQDINLPQTFISSDETLTFNYPENWYAEEFVDPGLTFFVVSNNPLQLTPENLTDPGPGEFLMLILPLSFLNLMLQDSVDLNATLEEVVDSFITQQGESLQLSEPENREFGSNRGVIVTTTEPGYASSVIFLDVNGTILTLIAAAPEGELEQYIETVYAVLGTLSYECLESNTFTFDYSLINFTYPPDWSAFESQGVAYLTNGNFNVADGNITQPGKVAVIIIPPGAFPGDVVGSEFWAFSSEREFSTLTHEDFLERVREVLDQDAEFSEVSEVTIGNYTAWRIDFTDEEEQQEGAALLVDVNSTPVMVVGTAYPGEFADWETTIADVVASFTIDSVQSIVQERIQDAAASGTTTLDLSYLALSDLPPEIGQLTSLEVLKLQGNQLAKLPPEMWQLTNLQELHLGCSTYDNCGGNLLTTLPPEIGLLTNLRELHLSYNQLEELPPEIGLLTNLGVLDLTHNRLTALPPEIGQLTNLQTLNLHLNSITELPPEIGLLTNLQSLDLAYNDLTILPPEIGQLTNLQTLNLHLTNIAELPPEIGLLTNLQSLDLSYNDLTTLPPEIGQLINLQTLNIEVNDIAELPPEIGQLTGLRAFNVEANEVSALPPEIGQLTNLQELNMYNNQLAELPPEIGQLTSLQILILWNNQLTELPPEIWQITNLQELDLSYNALTELPPEIGQLTKLQELDLDNNQFTELPPELCNLENLQDFYAEDNPMPREYPTDEETLTDWCE